MGLRASREKLSRPRGGYNRPAFHGPALGLALAIAGAGPAAAQAERVIFPDAARRFEFPLASPRASAMVGRIIHVSRGESAFGAEWEAEPALGEVWPLLAIARGKVPVTLHLGTEVYGRFSLADKSSALISSDWQVNAVITVDAGRWRLGFEGYHESSHLGDELGDVQLRGNVSYAAIDAVNVGRGGGALAVDYIGHRGGLLGKWLEPVLAGYAEAQEYTDWTVTWSGRAGVRLPDADGRRAFALLLNFLDGMSPQRQFYNKRTRYAGIEVRFDL